MANNMKRLGSRLRALRESEGLTQMQLSKDANVSQNWISSLERGDVDSPDPELLFALSAKLGLTPNDVATIAGWWQPAKAPEIPDDMRFTWERLVKLPEREREPLVTILGRMVNATYREAGGS